MTPPKPRWLRYLPAVLRNRIEHRPNLLAILSNTGWLFADKVLRMGVGLFVNVWVARYLGPEQYGLLNFAVAFVTLFGAFATLGLDSILVRELVKNPERQNELLGTAFALKLIGAVIAIILAVTAIAFVRSGEILTFWLVALTAAGFIFQSLNVIDFYFQANVKSRYTVYAANAAFILMTLAKVILLIFSAPLIAFAWVGLGEVVLTSLFLLLAYRVNYHNVRDWCYSFNVALELIKHIRILIISGLAISIAMRLDQVMIGEIVGLNEVGFYTVAVRFTELYVSLGLLISQGLFPRLISSSGDKFDRDFVLTTRYIFYILLFGAIFIAFFSKLLIHFTFGNLFIDSSILLSVLIFSVPITYLSIVSMNYLIKYGYYKEILLRQVSGLLINILINIILIKRYGALGAAIATVVTDISIAFAFDIKRKKFKHLLDIKFSALLIRRKKLF